jgi:hypothetical protein
MGRIGIVVFVFVAIGIAFAILRKRRPDLLERVTAREIALILVQLGAIALFSSIAFRVRADPTRFDLRMHHLALQISSRPADVVFGVLSALTSLYALVPLAGAAAALAWRAGARRDAVAILIVVFLVLVARLLPRTASSHASSAVGLLGIVSLAAARLTPRGAHAHRIAAILLTLGGALAAIYREHPATDVLAGLAVGIFVLAAGLLVMGPRRTEPPPPGPAEADRAPAPPGV